MVTNIIEQIQAEQNRIKTSRNWCRYVLPEKYDAKKVLYDLMCNATQNFQWHTEYEALAEYIQDNKGMGLMLQGNVGTGKTMFVNMVYKPIIKILYNRNIPTYNAEELNTNFESMQEKQQLFIDDIGREKVAKNWGTELANMDILADSLEKEDKLLICTTNLSTAELTQKYGERAIDRLKCYMKWVNFGTLTSQRPKVY